MKRIIIPLVVLFTALLCLQTQAQTLYPFPSPGLVQTEIYHQDWTQMFAPRNNSFVHTGDTMVGTYTYARFSWIPVGSSNPWYTWYMNGRVYYEANTPTMNPLNGTMIYDFTLNQGDTFHCPMWSFSIVGDYVVDLVQNVTLQNSQTRKYMRLVSTQGPDTLEWIDGIGDINLGFMYMTDFEGGREEFICARDSAGPLWSASNSAFNCNENNPIPTAGPNTCDQFTYNVQIYGTSCIGCDGVITVSNVSGGVPTYTYHWSNGATTPSVYNLCQGPITLTIYDATGDSCSRTFVVGENVINLNLQHGTDHCMYTDTFCLAPLGGNPPYFYQWSTGSNGPCEVFYSNGTYTVTAWDGNGCSSSQTITINNPAPLSASVTPTAPTCSTCCDGNLTVNVTGGVPPYSVTAPGWPSAGNFCSGWYHYCVTDSLDCNWCDSVYLAGPLAIDDPGTDHFSMSPNPASDILLINRINPEPAVAVLYDVSGKIAGEYPVPGATMQIDISLLADGVYFLVIDGHSEKLVVMRE